MPFLLSELSYEHLTSFNLVLFPAVKRNETENVCGHALMRIMLGSLHHIPFGSLHLLTMINP